MLDAHAKANTLEITFYVLASHLPLQRLEFTCKLIEKIYRAGQNCFVLTDTQEQAHHLDKLLWTFRAGSFIPHQIYQGFLPQLPQTILLGFADIPESRQNIIINLSAKTPEISQYSQRILEILDNSEFCIQAGRQRYRYYQGLGYTIQTHKMT